MGAYFPDQDQAEESGAGVDFHKNDFTIKKLKMTDRDICVRINLWV